jgi:hypothetical protein
MITTHKEYGKYVHGVLDLIGKTRGYLTVYKEGPKNKWGRTCVQCRDSSFPDAPDRIITATEFRYKRILGKQRPKGSGTISIQGYVKLFINGKSLAEHRIIMEKHLGRSLKKNETVHHRDGDRARNVISNLQLKVGTHSIGQTYSDLIKILKQAGCFIRIPKTLKDVL